MTRKTCIECGHRFSARRKDQLYCCTRHKWRATQRRYYHHNPAAARYKQKLRDLRPRHDLPTDSSAETQP